ncbi:MAG: hypothetical protein ACKOCW_03490, partial [Planctomycetaceae bacterium]
MARHDGTSERSAAPTRNGRVAKEVRGADKSKKVRAADNAKKIRAAEKAAAAAARQTPATGAAVAGEDAGGAPDVASAAVPRLSRRRVVARLGRLMDRLPDGAVRQAVRQVARHIARRDDGRQARGRRLGALLDAVAATPAGAERWRGCEAAAWGVARARREARARRGAAAIETTALVDRLQRCLATAVEAVGRGDTAAAACVLATAALLSDVAGCHDLEGMARAALEAEILDSVTADGAVRPARATDMAAIIAAAGRWAEARAATTSVSGRVPWNERTDARFRAAGDTALALLGPIDAARPGSIGRREAAAGGAGMVLLEVIEEAGGRKARATARHLQRSDGRAMAARGGTAGLLPRQRGLAEGGQAVIRSGWGPGDLRLWLDWEPAMPRLEIAVGSRTLVAGPWRVEVIADGRSVE